MKLEQQGINGTAQDLPINDNRMETGQMGCCVSVIVVFNPANGVYQNVRGYHGAGAIEEINAASLMAGIPNVQNTKFFVFAGPDNKSQFFLRMTKQWIRTNILATHPRVQITTHHLIADAWVDRAGNYKLTNFKFN